LLLLFITRLTIQIQIKR